MAIVQSDAAGESHREHVIGAQKYYQFNSLLTSFVPYLAIHFE